MRMSYIIVTAISQSIGSMKKQSRYANSYISEIQEYFEEI
jgi:hypothetical protein